MESTKERIYIGGLNPPRLSARDIFRRLKSLDQIEIEDNDNINDNDGDSSDDEYGSNSNPYLHITAVSRHDSDSALSIVSKQYHNVKWKGCKLVVEKAKPHFLERLDEERRQRQRLVKAKELAAATDDAIENNKNNTTEPISDESPPPSASQIPRRLRVRKKYGEAAFHVDTKPWTVENWSRFHKARSKLQKQEENHRTKTVVAASKKQNYKDEQPFSAPGPLLHRAVHIRFLAAEEKTTKTGRLNDTSSRISSDSRKDNDENSNESESSTTPSVSSSSDSDSDIESLNEGGTHEEEYAWSGDDNDSDSDNSVVSNENKDNPDDDNGSQSTTEMLLNQKHKEGNGGANSETHRDDRTTSYQWSTDEESSDDEDENKKSLTTTWPSSSNGNKGLGNNAFSCTDEFMAGFEESASNFDKDDENEDDESDGDYGDQTRSGGGGHGVVEPDLVGDVTTNLNILSSIFPDMVNAKPIDPACNDGDSNNANNKERTSSSSNATKSSNITAYGIMPRYDPTAESSRQYVVEEEPTNRDDDENDSRSSSSSKQDAGDDDDDDDDDDDVMNEEKRKNESHTKSSPAAHDIYEQDELENVFRDARDAWGADDTRTSMDATSNTSATIPNPDNSSGKSSGFSFGFNLDDHDSTSKKQKTSAENSAAKDSFSFSFSIPDQNQADSNAKQDDATNNNIQTTKQKGDESMDASTPCLDERDSKTGDDDDVDMIVTDENAVLRHKGLTLPERDLQTYVDNFFACNDGARIMQDPGGFRNDDRDKATWIRERQTLTMDWKRKRKYAVTRIQKRMKARRR